MAFGTLFILLLVAGLVVGIVLSHRKTEGEGVTSYEFNLFFTAAQGDACNGEGDVVTWYSSKDRINAGDVMYLDAGLTTPVPPTQLPRTWYSNQSVAFGYSNQITDVVGCA